MSPKNINNLNRAGQPPVRSARMVRTGPEIRCQAMPGMSGTRPAALSVVSEPAPVEYVDISSAVKQRIAITSSVPPERLFPMWDKLVVFQGAPAEQPCPGNIGTADFEQRSRSEVSLAYDFEGSDEKYPTGISGVTVWSGNRQILESSDGIEIFTNKVFLELVQTLAMHRHLKANKHRQTFPQEEILKLRDARGYFLWLATMKVFFDAEEFMGDRSNTALAARFIMNAARETFSQDNGIRAKGMRKIIRKNRSIEAEFVACGEMFYKLFLEPTNNAIVLGEREKLSNALETLNEGPEILKRTPYAEMDEGTRAAADEVIEKTINFISCVKTKYKSETAWWMIAALEKNAAIRASGDVTDQIKRRIASMVNGDPTKMFYAWDMISVKTSRAKNAGGEAPCGQHILEQSISTKINYQNTPGVKQKKPERTFPKAIESVEVRTAGHIDINDPSQAGDLSSMILAKLMELNIFWRLLQVNASANRFNEKELQELCNDGQYVNWLAPAAILKAKDIFRLDERQRALFLMRASIGNVGMTMFDSGRQTEDTRNVLARSPNMLEEFESYINALNMTMFNDAKEGGGLSRSQAVNSATLSLINNRHKLYRDSFEEVDPVLRTYVEVLDLAFVQYFGMLDHLYRDRTDWLLLGNQAQVPVVLPFQTIRAENIVVQAIPGPDAASKGPSIKPADIAEEAKAEIPCFNGEALLGTLEKGIKGKQPFFVAGLCANALQTLRAFSGKEKRWFLPELAGLQKEAVSRILYGDMESLSPEARLALSTENDEGLVELSVNMVDDDDPHVSGSAAKYLLQGGFNTTCTDIVIKALSDKLVQGKQAPGLSETLVAFAVNLLGKKGKKPSGLKAKELLLPVISSVEILLKNINAKVNDDTIFALRTLNRLLEGHRMFGLLDELGDKARSLEELHMAATQKIAESSRDGRSDPENRVRVAYTIITNGHKDSDAREVAAGTLFEALGQNGLTPVLMSALEQGISALIRDNHPEARERLFDYIRDNVADRNRSTNIMLAAYILGNASKEKVVIPDINTIEESAVAEILKGAKVHNPERMAAIVVKCRPFEGIAGLERKQIKGLGQERQRVIKALRNNVIDEPLRQAMTEAINSGDPILCALAVEAASIIRRPQEQTPNPKS